MLRVRIPGIRRVNRMILHSTTGTAKYVIGSIRRKPNSVVDSRFSCLRSLSLKIENPSNLEYDREETEKNWNSLYRPVITDIIRNISEDENCHSAANVKGIDSPLWLQYANKFRRTLIKDPMHALGNEEAMGHLITLLDGVIAAEGSGTSQKQQQQMQDASAKKESKIRKKEDNTGVRQRKQSQLEPFDACKQYLLQTILRQAEIDLSGIIRGHEVLSNMSDLRLPHEWYAHTRLMKRKIIYHGGPTNSGKTYHALKRLEKARPELGGGLYCGPLRLLALEVYDKLNREAGVPTSLLTGQEKREVPGASHVSCTLEMANLNQEYDVVVIDEIQMIADKQRGYAWTRALLGLRAREIHVCGGLEAQEVVRSLADTCGDEFVLEEYKRLSTLVVSEESLRGDYTKVQPGDCVVAFSKADIFSIKRQIEQGTPYKCAVIYGQLPPETRSTQARLFNEDGTGFDILVASDAVGMGLNLNIRRIVFHTTIKRDRDNGFYWVDPSNVKQIGGRAGRLSSQYKIGEVTAWQEADLAYVRAVMQWDIPQITSAGIFPTVEQIEIFSQQLQQSMAVYDQQQRQEQQEQQEQRQQQEEEEEGLVQLDATDRGGGYKQLENELVFASLAENTNTGDMGDSRTHLSELLAVGDHTNSNRGGPGVAISADAASAEDAAKSLRLAEILQRFVRLSKVDSRFFLCEYEGMVTVANWLHPIPLSIAERFVFANAPVNIGDAAAMNMLYHFAACYAQGRPVALNVRLTKALPQDLISFGQLCIKHTVLDLYLWLSIRFPKYFIEQDKCLQQKLFAIKQIEAALLRHNFKQDHSHGRSYLSLRRVMAKKGGRDFHLPPQRFGSDLRDRTAKYLEAVPSALRCILPKSAYEPRGGQRQGYGQGQGQRIDSKGGANRGRSQQQVSMHGEDDRRRGLGGGDDKTWNTGKRDVSGKELSRFRGPAGIDIVHRDKHGPHKPYDSRSHRHRQPQRQPHSSSHMRSSDSSGSGSSTRGSSMSARAGGSKNNSSRSRDSKDRSTSSSPRSSPRSDSGSRTSKKSTSSSNSDSGSTTGDRS